MRPRHHVIRVNKPRMPFRSNSICITPEPLHYRVVSPLTRLAPSIAPSSGSPSSLAASELSISVSTHPSPSLTSPLSARTAARPGDISDGDNDARARCIVRLSFRNAGVHGTGTGVRTCVLNTSPTKSPGSSTSSGSLAGFVGVDGTDTDAQSLSGRGSFCVGVGVGAGAGLETPLTLGSSGMLFTSCKCALRAHRFADLGTGPTPTTEPTLALCTIGPGPPPLENARCIGGRGETNAAEVKFAVLGPVGVRGRYEKRWAAERIGERRVVGVRACRLAASFRPPLTWCPRLLFGKSVLTAVAGREGNLMRSVWAFVSDFVIHYSRTSTHHLQLSRYPVTRQM